MSIESDGAVLGSSIVGGGVASKVLSNTGIGAIETFAIGAAVVLLTLATYRFSASKTDK